MSTTWARLTAPTLRPTLFDAAIDFRGPSHAGRIEQQVVLIPAAEFQVDHVAGSSGLVVDQRQCATGKPVDQRGFAYVGPSDDCHAADRISPGGLLFVFFLFGDSPEYRVLEGADPRAVFGGYRQWRVDSQAAELSELVFLGRAFDLVRHVEHG